jgi:hypothetical protein
MFDRRDFIKIIGRLTSTAILGKFAISNGYANTSHQRSFPKETGADVFSVKDADTRQATFALLEMMGGIASIINSLDIVVIKPNSQWWAQGMTHTGVMASFIEAILGIPGFDGEIIITDNHQDMPANSRAWTTDKRNGPFNYNELINYFQEKGHKNVSKYHLSPAGANPTPLQMKGHGNSRVNHPSEGDGYIWPENLFYESPEGNRTLLSYPVFTSAYSGTTIDFKKGAFKNNQYTDQPVKFINMAVLNHHGGYAGATASIKNYMGLVDMSCGYPAPQPENTFNTHHVGASALFRFLAPNKNWLKKIPGFHSVYLHPSVFQFHFTGGVLGSFMQKIRKADLNIITAINVGWGSRTDTSKSFAANTILASIDPVALDYYATEKLLVPASKQSDAPQSIIDLNNPRNEAGPLNRFLEECRRETGGTADLSKLDIIAKG